MTTTASERWEADRVLIDSADARRYLKLGYWSDHETVSSLLRRNAAEFPRRVAIVDDRGGSFTYADLDDLSSRVAAALAARGVKPGDVVGMQMYNRVEAATISYGIERAGAIACPMAPMFREREILHAANKSGMTALFSSGVYRGYDHDALALRVAEQAPSLETLVSISERPSQGLLGFRELTSGERGSDFELHPDDPAALMFSSGTEAEPKGALYTNNTMLAKMRSIQRALGLGESDNVFMGSPVAHGTGYVFGLRLALWLGSRLVFMDKWDPAEAVEVISRERCGYTHGSTPFVKELLANARDDLDFSGFRYFVTGGVSVPQGFVGQLRELFGAQLLRMYGQTEAGTMTVHRPWDDMARHETSEGLALPSVELKIVDDAGRDAPPNTVGEAVSRSPLRCIGFLGDRKRALATLTHDGFMKTGDLLTIDEGGYVAFVSRKKDIINRGGYKYSPRDVEDVLQSHPAIKLAAIVPIADSRLGERACLFAVLYPGGSLDLVGLTAFLEEAGVAKFKWPERLEILDELPTTPMGKVKKHVLATMVNA